MRVLVFTGKGGVGTTTAAAATATLGALRGLRTLVMSTDAAHSLGDVFDADIGPDPTEVDERLYAQQIDAQRRFEQSWTEFGALLAGALARSGPGRAGPPGFEPLHAEEAVVAPGLEELMVLFEIAVQLRSGHWDMVVIDGAPTAHALRLLALPETVLHYIDRLVRPGPRPAGVVERLRSELDELRTVLSGPDTSVRIVLTPDSVVVAEARRAATILSLYGYDVDGVVANKLFPRHGGDAWRRQWIAAQDVVLGEVAQAFETTPVFRSTYRSCEPIGLGELAAFAAEAYGTTDPFARSQRYDRSALPAIVKTREGTDVRFGLPDVRSADIALARKDNQLVLTVGSYRRILTLPDELRQAQVIGASLHAGRLVVRFGHDVEAGGGRAWSPGTHTGT